MIVSDFYALGAVIQTGTMLAYAEQVLTQHPTYVALRASLEQAG